MAQHQGRDRGVPARRSRATRARGCGPSFWPTTHDILPPYLQVAGGRGFAVRAVLAATGSPTWGIYSGYELVENVPRPGVEEQIDNEKYEFKPRDWSQAEHLGIALLLGNLNAIRRGHPALRQLRNLRVHPTSDDATLAFSKHLVGRALARRAARTPCSSSSTSTRGTPARARSRSTWRRWACPSRSTARDLLTHEEWTWGSTAFVRLDPAERPAHVVALEAP